MTLSFRGYEPIDEVQATEVARGRGGDVAGAPAMFASINASAKPLNLNARLIGAVVFHETGALTSWRYENWRNPGGIAISSSGSVEVWRPDVPTPEQAGAMMVAAIGQKVLRRSVSAEVPIAYRVRGMMNWLSRSLSFTQAPGYPSETHLTTHMVLPFRDATGELQYVWAEDQDWWKGVEAYYAILRTGKDDDDMAEALKFGNVKHPAYVDRLIPNSENGAWDDLGPRRGIGVCQHSMVGSLWGTDGWFRRGAASNGLTDYGIGNSTDGAQWDGVIIRWNDPLGRRSGWANGGSDGLEMDGPLYVRTLGVNAINRDLVSIERSDGGDTNTPMSAKQFASICSLTAHWFDHATVGFDVFPMNKAFGIVTHLLHLEFATKTCPHHPVVSRIDEIQDRVRAILKAGQTLADIGDPIPPVTPPKPNHNDWSPFKKADLIKRYGTFPMTQHDGTEQTSNWDDKGSIPNAWVARARAEGITKVTDIPKPRVGHISEDATGNQHIIVIFDGPRRDAWILFRPDRDVAWAWVR
jgi:hypothetical protein